MKVLQQIIFTIAMVVGLTFAVSAQKNDDQKKPPKPPPPVVTPQPKPPPKKPGEAIVIWKSEMGETA